MSNFDAIVVLSEAYDGDDVFNALEIMTFLQEKHDYTHEETLMFIHELKTFWAEADAANELFNKTFNGNAKPIPEEGE